MCISKFYFIEKNLQEIFWQETAILTNNFQNDLHETTI